MRCSIKPKNNNTWYSKEKHNCQHNTIHHLISSLCVSFKLSVVLFIAMLSFHMTHALILGVMAQSTNYSPEHERQRNSFTPAIMPKTPATLTVGMPH